MTQPRVKMHERPKSRRLFFVPCLVACACIVGWPAFAEEATYRIVERVAVDKVPSWFPVGFCLLTRGEFQYVAYYNQERQMIAARRALADDRWQKVTLPTKVGWDSHNYVTMAIDSVGDIHLSGNMHCVPLISFRTRAPGDITTFARLPMMGQEEQRCTYPRFLTDADGRLLFTYRSGGSGNGRRFYNVARFQDGQWGRHPITTWDKRTAFSGRGAMPFIGIAITGLQRFDTKTLFLGYRHRDYGSGHIVLDETKLEPIDRELTIPTAYPRSLTRPTIPFSGMSVRTAQDLGRSVDATTKYILRWETLDAHQDRPRQPPLPPPSLLELVKLERTE